MRNFLQRNKLCLLILFLIGISTEPLSAQERCDNLVEQLLEYADQLKGVPYKYGKSDPKVGFDCSGFVAHVFGHMGKQVPRSSRGYNSKVGEKVTIDDARPGDIIIFTGPRNAGGKVPGHVGIVYQTEPELKFIHATSGREKCVTITPLTASYKRRFIKIVRLSLDN